MIRIWARFGLGLLPIGRRAPRVVELHLGNQTTVTIAWNTTGVPYGNYTLTASATIVLGETDITDNTYTDGWVLVTLVGDADGDFYVGSSDVFTLAPAYGSQPGDSNWNHNCDFDDDGYIGSMDVFILAPNYGKSA
ncbi:MAG: hypothetical protein ACETVP_04320 [Candidatus Bathyarchaeia archaeon]